MSEEDQDGLERLLGKHNLAWLLGGMTSKAKALPLLRNILTRVGEGYRARTGLDENFSPKALEEESSRNPQKIEAFLQALAVTQNPDMLVMVWRILQGSTIRDVAMQYQEREHFQLVVRLARYDGQDDRVEDYQSTDIHDAGLLRHFGIAMIDGRPLFDGFYALRVG